jgi:erythromycin esterase
MLKKIRLLIAIASLAFQILAFISCQMEDEDQSTDVEQPTDQQQLIQELNQWLIPLERSPLDLTDTDLSFLDQLTNAKLVALGEATHGTKEFFQMKHRIFKYLVEYCQHKAFGFEADFAESLYFDNYICKGEGDLEELMITKMHFWTWRTEEVKQLLEWMKDYNTGRREEEKIHYYGIDCQYTTYQPEFIQEHLERTFPVLWETAAPVLEQARELSNYDSQETYIDLKTQLESLENQLIANKDLIIANSSLKEYEITKQLFNNFKQVFIKKYHSAIEDYRVNWRDQFMAENALWIADFLGQDTKITLWAHNGHVAKNSSLRDAAGYAPGEPMGYHLNEELGNQYQVVGFSFSLGSFTARTWYQGGHHTDPRPQEITTNPRSDSINFIFHNASHPNFAFHLDTIPAGSEWDNWLKTPRPFLGIGAVFSGVPSDHYTSTDIRGHYNWIIHFDRTTASEPILRY